MSTTTPDLKQIRIEQLTESKLNPRKHFDAEELAKLAASITAKGVIQPLTVRGKGKGYEIVVGARRYRASKLAGLSDVPCVIRELTDLDVLEIMVIENNHRENVHPLEEADGYRALMKQGHYDVAALAARVGRSVNYVYDRVKLLELTKDAQDLFWDGLITAGHAILLARLSPADQTRVIGSKDDDYADGGLFTHQRNLRFTPEEEDDDAEDDPLAQLKAVSVRELQAYIDEHVKFDRNSVDQLLFPETAEMLKVTSAERHPDRMLPPKKVVQITHEACVNPDAKEGNTERIYCYTSWARADGKHGSKTCDRQVIGVIVAGPGRGQAFEVCTDKQKCTVHWGEEIKERNQRQKSASAGSTTSGKTAADKKHEQQQRKEAEEQAHRQIENERWEKAIPAMLTALAGAVKKAPTKAGGLLGSVIFEVLDRNCDSKAAAKYIPRGTSADDLIRHCAFMILMDEATSYYALEEFPARLKAFGLDVKKLLGPMPVALKDCTVCGAKAIDPTKHVCSPSALKKAKASKPATGSGEKRKNAEKGKKRAA